jgi:hypothetical protein
VKLYFSERGGTSTSQYFLEEPDDGHNRPKLEAQISKYRDINRFGCD